MFTLIEHGEVYTPEPRGVQAVLLANETIVKIGAVDARKLAALDLPCVTIDAAGCVVVPGFVDPHAHLIGAGGEQGFASRNAEVSLGELLQAGITTVVGLLGTDTVTRHLTTLLGKARQLTAEGITAYLYTGGFQVPTPTITGSVMDDLILIDRVLGVGEIAISDQRAVAPSLEELAKLVSAAFIGGMVGGKAGVTHFHTGPGKERLRLLHRLLDEHEIAPECLYPTHIGRSEALMDDAIALAKRGAFVDIDTVERDLSKWLLYYWEHGGPRDRLTISSDAHTRGHNLYLYNQFVAVARDARQPLAHVLPCFTHNPAGALRLDRKGRLAVGADGDVLVLRQDSLEIVHLIARGRHLVRDGQTLVERQTGNPSSE